MSAALLLVGGGTAAILSHVTWSDPASCSSDDDSGSCSTRTEYRGCCSTKRNTTKLSAGTDTPVSVPSDSATPVENYVTAVAQDKAQAPAVKKVEVGKNVFLEVEGEKRRVVIQSYVCLREGQLEQLLTKKNAKEHEAILAADLDASVIHTALLLCQAKAGHPVRFQPKLEAPTGTGIKIMLEYKDKDKVVRIPAQQWIRSAKTKKNMTYDWVFAGSILTPDPFDPKAAPFYGANSGDVICVSNMETALLDLPINSSRENGDLNYEAHTERIPAVETPVLIILEPVLETKKK